MAKQLREIKTKWNHPPEWITSTEQVWYGGSFWWARGRRSAEKDIVIKRNCEIVAADNYFKRSRFTFAIRKSIKRFHDPAKKCWLIPIRSLLSLKVKHRKRMRWGRNGTARLQKFRARNEFQVLIDMYVRVNLQIEKASSSTPHHHCYEACKSQLTLQSMKKLQFIKRLLRFPRLVKRSQIEVKTS